MDIRFKVTIVGDDYVKTFSKEGWIDFIKVPIIKMGDRYYTIPHYEGPFYEGQEIEITESDLGEEIDPEYV